MSQSFKNKLKTLIETVGWDELMSGGRSEDWKPLIPMITLSVLEDGRKAMQKFEKNLSFENCLLPAFWHL